MRDEWIRVGGRADIEGCPPGGHPDPEKRFYVERAQLSIGVNTDEWVKQDYGINFLACFFFARSKGRCRRLRPKTYSLHILRGRSETVNSVLTRENRGEFEVAERGGFEPPIRLLTV